MVSPPQRKKNTTQTSIYLVNYENYSSRPSVCPGLNAMAQFLLLYLIKKILHGRDPQKKMQGGGKSEHIFFLYVILYFPCNFFKFGFSRGGQVPPLVHPFSRGGQVPPLVHPPCGVKWSSLAIYTIFDPANY